MLETSYKKLNGMECDGSAWDYQNWDTHRLFNMNKKYSVSHIYSIYFASVLVEALFESVQYYC